MFGLNKLCLCRRGSASCIKTSFPQTLLFVSKTVASTSGFHWHSEKQMSFNSTIIMNMSKNFLHFCVEASKASWTTSMAFSHGSPAAQSLAAAFNLCRVALLALYLSKAFLSGRSVLSSKGFISSDEIKTREEGMQENKIKVCQCRMSKLLSSSDPRKSLKPNLNSAI